MSAMLMLNYCHICNFSTRVYDDLLLHRRTKTHKIAKLEARIRRDLEMLNQLRAEIKEGK